ncbi:hypothetical protein GC096_08255 [Paenibacillus sp. LMG 31461]|uniref:Uncharacterized protein n=1 Tax=Paenibacillus plantarum TaxID=2654975 RepID=A0ABX1X6T4_9BACL|nr:hypothetical protein [Paenibacillus plantarum]NOU64014.1 hypothetical protein [Paenibacillus plantarum]
MIVDFTRFFGKTIVLKNVFKGASPETTDVMQFRVATPLKGKDTSSLPDHLMKFDFLSREMATRTRDLTLVRVEDKYGILLNLLDGKRWSDCISEKMELGTIFYSILRTPFLSLFHHYLLTCPVIGVITTLRFYLIIKGVSVKNNEIIEKEGKNESFNLSGD